MNGARTANAVDGRGIARRVIVVYEARFASVRSGITPWTTTGTIVALKDDAVAVVIG
jgi:hypothetical protein